MINTSFPLIIYIISITSLFEYIITLMLIRSIYIILLVLFNWFVLFGWFILLLFQLLCLFFLPDLFSLSDLYYFQLLCLSFLPSLLSLPDLCLSCALPNTIIIYLFKWFILLLLCIFRTWYSCSTYLVCSITALSLS